MHTYTHTYKHMHMHTHMHMHMHMHTHTHMHILITGADAMDWLISWAFVEDRESAAALASEILRYGFFNPVHLDLQENVYEKIRDTVLAREMVDAQDAYYDFVSRVSVCVCVCECVCVCV